MGLPQMCLIHRAYPIQVTIFQMENDLGLVQWCKIFPLCSPHKGKVLPKQVPLTGFHPNPVLWLKISPLFVIQSQESTYCIQLPTAASISTADTMFALLALIVSA